MQPIPPEPNTPAGEIAYILNGYPRLSEVFVTNEIHLLESMGLRLRILAMKRPVEEKSQTVAQRIHAEVTYLPRVEPMKGSYLVPWLCKSVPRFVRSHVRLWKLRPRAYRQTLWEALRLSVQPRFEDFSLVKKTFLKEFLQAGAAALQILEAGRVCHIHAHFAHGATTMAMFISRLCGLPFSFTAHAKDIYQQAQNAPDLLCTKLRRAQFVVTCTATNAAYLKQLCTTTAPIHTVYHGLDTTLFQRAVGLPPVHTLPLVLAVGRCVEKKGFPFLVQACRLLKDQGYAFQCRIVGEPGDQTDTVKRMIRALHLEDTITLQDAVPHEELRDIYQHSSIFALPCQIVDDGDRDGIPNVLAEAMAMELPVVSTAVSGILELVEPGVDGLLVPPQDATALAGALAQLLKDPELRQNLGRAARAKVCQQFDARKNIVVLQELFVSCLMRPTATEGR